MRKIGYLVIVITGIGIGLYSTIKKRANASNLETGQQLFNNYCIGCHNDKKSSFIAREWLFGGNKEEIINSIKHGRVSFGMPSFSDGLSDREIESMADYILAMAKNTPKGKSNNHVGVSLHKTEAQAFTVDTIVSGLDVPWGLEFLPDGSLLISERSGELLHLSPERQLTKVSNAPAVLAEGQGGLLDLELHPDYKNNGWIYLAYSCPDEENNKKANTAIMRARLENHQLIDNEIIFKAFPATDKRHHYGCKLEFDKEGYLYFSVGDRGERDRHPQSLDNDCGKIHRIKDDGSIPVDNPFVKTDGARPSIYSYGHRNPQGVCMHPETGRIWTDEHGPKGGDEINLIEPGKNYGWPVISFGINYNGTTFTNDTAKAGMEQPIHYWVPSIAPCGMTFVKGERYPNWKNNILTGSLRYEYLHRVVLDSNKVSYEEKLLNGIGRVRNVEMSPDGYIYVAIEKPGKILKLIPQ